MKVLVVLEFEMPQVDDIVQVLNAVDPPRLPWFDGAARIVVEPHATQLIDWLEEE